MDPVAHAPNPALHAHRHEAQRVLELPVEVSGLRWHPFGVYTMPLASRTDAEGRTWSRRLHVWHPEGTPVGEASPYGVHTHSGTARSHVLAGSLHHHLYAFDEDPEGAWQKAALGEPVGRAALRHHIWAPTRAGTTHTLPANQPHGVTKPPGFALSLFEQLDTNTADVFTTWQRTDVPAEPLVRAAPVAPRQVAHEALQVLEATALA